MQDDESVWFIWAVVYPPSWQPNGPGEEMVADPLPRNLTAQGRDRYAVEYEKFTETGLYRVVLHAVDRDGLRARPYEVQVWVGGARVYLPVVLRQR